MDNAIQRRVNDAKDEIEKLIAQARDEHQRLKLGRQQAIYAAILAARTGIDVENPFCAASEPALRNAWNQGIKNGLSATVPEINQAINGRMHVKSNRLAQIGRTHADHVHEHLERNSAA